MGQRVAVIGGGQGLVCVLAALRDASLQLTAIVPPVGSGLASRGDETSGPHSAPSDVALALIGLARNGALARAIARPLTIARGQPQPLADLMLQTLSRAFGDPGEAIRWLGQRLGIQGCVIPSAPLLQRADGGPGRSVASAAMLTAYSGSPPQRAHDDPSSSDSAVHAIGQAQWIVLAAGGCSPGALALCASPAITTALQRTPVPVVYSYSHCWQASSSPIGMDEELVVLRRQGVRVDAAVYEPARHADLFPPALDG